MGLTQERLKKVLHYNKETGVFTRLECFQRPDVIGPISLDKSGNGYLRIAIDGKRYYAHRLAWFYVNGKWPDSEIDHMNGDRADNKWSNIRSASRLMNSQNMKRANSHSKSGVRGVSWDSTRNKWIARIKVGKRYLCLGRFDDQKEAQRAYISAKRANHVGYVER